MSRADLHYALAADREIYEAAQVDPGLLDPIVRVPGGLPGVARPFLVVRDYQGPVGYYTESFAILDRRGRELHRSGVRRVRLRGEMFEDRFSDVVTGLAFDDPDEHRLAFWIDDEPVGEIPLFLEAGMGGDPRLAAEETFKKAVGKGEIVWLTVPQPASGRRGAKAEHTQAVWFLTQGTKLYVLVGPGEQEIPGLPGADEIEITARSKDHRSRVSRAVAAVRVVPKDAPEWNTLAEAAAPKRLNLPDKTFQDAIQRWRETCEFLELTPRFSTAAA